MPTIASAVVPPPASWTEFEEIVLSAAKLRWRSTEFYRNGRSGQKQDGVDIWGHDLRRRHIGLQCKNTLGGVSIKVVVDEIDNATSFEPTLDHLYITTTAERDAPLQRQVRILSDEREAQGLFGVGVLFWDDVCGDLAGDDDVFFKHYPQFRGRGDPAKDHDRALFDELTGLLKTNGVIGFLDQNNMAGFAFREKLLEPLREFYFEWNAPEREFLSRPLDEIRNQLWQKVDAYYGILASETYPLDHNPELHTVPPELEVTDPERFWRIVNGLHKLAGEIVALHSILVRTGKSVLLGGGSFT